MNRRSNRMLLLICSVFAIITLAVCINVFCVTILGIHIRSNTDIKQYTSETKKETLSARRGVIYDVNGKIVAQDTTTYTIVAVLDENRPGVGNKPAYVKDPIYTANMLGPIINMDTTELLKYLTKDVYQTEFGSYGKNLSLEQKQKIEELALPGIEFTTTTTRTYPLGPFASHLIGFAQYDAEQMKLIGKMGFEQSYNEELSGVDGYSVYQTTKDGYVLPGSKVVSEQPINGNDMYLTIDSRIQETLELSLSQSMQQLNTSKAWGAVMNVKTGQILAWGSYPTFDPNTKIIDDYSNMGSQVAYEPGSTMKAFTYAAAIDSGVYNGEAIFDSSSFKMGVSKGNPVRVYGDKYVEIINNANKKSWGYIDLNKGFRYSSNVAIATILTEYLDTKRFQEYLHSFGFFQKVDTDRVPEINGTENYKYPIEKLALGYGQGSSVTMLQILQGYSAIFNSGEMVKPYFVQQIKNPTTNEIVYQKSEKTVVGNPISADTAKQMQKLMYDVINTEDGSGKYYRLEDVDVIGKTGTAQVYKNGKYDDTKVIASVAVGFPFDDPEIMIYYAFECDYTNQSHVRTEPIVQLIRKTAFTYNLTKEVEVNEGEKDLYKEVKRYTMPNLINHSVDYAKNKLADMDVDIVILGNGKSIISQYPSNKDEVVSYQKVFLLTDESQFNMPDMTGWSRKDVTAFWSLTNSKMEIQIDGFGKVYEQSIPPLTIVYPNTAITVKLK